MENFIDDMVTFDPLYVVDESMDLLLPTMSKYNEDYQRRLRMYVSRERETEYVLEMIPSNQIGICLVYNLFEFRPLEVIKNYLTEIHKKLRDGGTVIITINDCDNEKAVRLVENHYCCYTPGTLVKTMAESLGFKILYHWNWGGPSSWIELQKPGTITSLRGGQSLAKIIHKSVAESK
jgi:hypothetical protein